MSAERPVVWMGSSLHDVREFPFPEAIVVLHAFKKKSNKARETDQRDVDRVEKRLQWADELQEKGILLEYGEKAE